MAISASVKALVEGKQVAGSKISSQLLEELLAEGMLSVIPRGSRKSYRALDTEALKRFLMDKDESYRILDVDSSDTRAATAKDTGNSKLTTIRSCPGFPVNSYEPIECLLNGEPLLINPQRGTFLFVTDWETFIIPDDVIVVGVENMENFRMIRRQRQLCENYLQSHGLSTKVLFVSRYPQSLDLRRWLCGISNHYLHFGDFDLAGISIFITEFQRYLGDDRSSFLIPDDIGYRLKSGSAKRYDDQYYQYKDVKSDVCELQSLIDLINKERKSYDQEGYIG